MTDKPWFHLQDSSTQHIVTWSIEEAIFSYGRGRERQGVLLTSEEGEAWDKI
jgi:hypothetical protein